MRIQSIYRGLKGFVRVYESALEYRYMITDKALHKARVLVFWEKHGLNATLDAFKVKRRTLFLWKKQFIQGDRKVQGLNERSKSPKRKRSRLWHPDVIAELKRLRFTHPNLGKEKLYPLLLFFCKPLSLKCPKPGTIARLIKDLGGLRVSPRRLSLGSLTRKPQKRAKVLRKPKNFQAEYPGHLVALDTIEKQVLGKKYYLITFEDIYTRFCFAISTASHASLAAREFFNYCLKVFPFPIDFVLTDNGSEFKKHFNQRLKQLHLTHYHTYPKTPKMNAHCERFNRTIQEEYVNYHLYELTNTQKFNQGLMDYLIWYNTRRVHWAFQNKLTPVDFILSLDSPKLTQECKMRWTHTII